MGWYGKSGSNQVAGNAAGGVRISEFGKKGKKERRKSEKKWKRSAKQDSMPSKRSGFFFQDFPSASELQAFFDYLYILFTEFTCERFSDVLVKWNFGKLIQLLFQILFSIFTEIRKKVAIKHWKWINIKYFFRVSTQILEKDFRTISGFSWV